MRPAISACAAQTLCCTAPLSARPPAPVAPHPFARARPAPAQRPARARPARHPRSAIRRVDRPRLTRRPARSVRSAAAPPQPITRPYGIASTAPRARSQGLHRYARVARAPPHHQPHRSLPNARARSASAARPGSPPRSRRLAPGPKRRSAKRLRSSAAHGPGHQRARRNHPSPLPTFPPGGTSQTTQTRCASAPHHGAPAGIGRADRLRRGGSSGPIAHRPRDGDPLGPAGSGRRRSFIAGLFSLPRQHAPKSSARPARQGPPRNKISRHLAVLPYKQLRKFS